MPEYRISDAARLLSVSDDTLRRWADAGRIATVTDSAGRRVVDGSVLARFAVQLAGRSEALPIGPIVAESDATGSPAWSPGCCATG